MTASVELEQAHKPRPALELIVAPGSTADQLAELVAGLVSLVDAPVDPKLINPAALVLQAEDLLDLTGVTFGCNYELDIRSIELDRGYVRAIDAGWLKLRRGTVTASARFSQTRLAGSAQQAGARGRELFALDGDALSQIARHHLLRDAANWTRNHTP